MAVLDIKNVKITGISACVPSKIDSIPEIYKWKGAENFIQSTGIAARRRTTAALTSSDLCFAAAEKLISELQWDKSEIGALIFVTQTPDYILPATSCILQDRIGLSKECYTLDISLGCSGWVYALSVITALMQNGSIRKGLLLSGDTITKMCNSEDKSSYPLFGDAGTATALEFSKSSGNMFFILNTDGGGAETIIVRDGGYRYQATPQSFQNIDNVEGITRNRLNIELDGMNVFSFGITKAPKSVTQLCDQFKINKDDVDLFTFHQANKMMNEMIRKKLKIPTEKVPYSMDQFGNTSSASIPLTLVIKEADKLRKNKLKHIACGFGVGLSWGSVFFETNRIKVPELIEI
ncbi:MAG: ketoacyl-ACP synthase III [Bacteroides sp.]|nr:ketoacyl-ACP synthase III [Bacteroides sp.]